MVDVVQLSQLNIELKCDFSEESVIVLISSPTWFPQIAPGDSVTIACTVSPLRF